MSAVSWSDWVDFNKETINNAPETPGVFMMHAAMKILYIGNSHNLRSELLESLNNPCISEATRFRYASTENHATVRDELIEDYKKRHDEKMPKCM